MVQIESHVVYTFCSSITGKDDTKCVWKRTLRRIKCFITLWNTLKERRHRGNDCGKCQHWTVQDVSCLGGSVRWPAPQLQGALLKDRASRCSIVTLSFKLQFFAPSTWHRMNKLYLSWGVCNSQLLARSSNTQQQNGLTAHLPTWAFLKPFPCLLLANEKLLQVPLVHLMRSTC